MRPLRAASVLVAAACGTTACSVLLDWSNFSGGLGDGGAGADAAIDGLGEASGADAADTSTGDSAATCGLACVAASTAGWAGPLALYVGPTGQGASPPCGPGFDATSAFDGFGELTAPTPTCSACSCTPSVVTCAGPVLSFFADDGCATPVGSITASSSCQTTPFTAQSVTIGGAMPSGGSCGSTGGALTSAAPSWAQAVRACAPSAVPASTGCDAGLVCAPAPAAPFSTRPCVMQAGMATACPPEYPTGPQTFFTGIDDQRGCTACQCAGPTGAQCTIGSPALDVSVTPGCSVTTGTLDAPSACTQFQGPEFVTLARQPTLTSPGSCAVAGGGTPTGGVTAAGATSFCCAL
jgi:hypothetical protein